MDELARLYDVARDDELAVLDTLAIRAGLLWQCRCGWMNGAPGPRRRARSCGGCPL